jgi:hypothetical protein
MDGREQGGIGADEGRVLQGQQPAVRLAAFADPLIGQVHRPGTMRRRRPDRVLRLAVRVAVQAGQGANQLRGGRGVIDRGRARPVLVLAMHAPPGHLELGGLGGAGGLAVGQPHQGIEPPHAGQCTLGVVVRVRRPQLVGP